MAEYISPAAQHGRAVLRDLADPSVTEKAAALVLEGRAAWQYDPEVSRVVGLLDTGTDRAYIIVYGDEDFEITTEFEALRA